MELPLRRHSDAALGSQDESGFALIGLIVAIFLVLLVLSLAAPRVAQELRRDREVESMHRANQYVRGIQVFYRKFGRYPTDVDQLEKSGGIRFVRQKYADPMTGKTNWRLIHVGEAKTTVKGFFGKPLTGLDTQNIGSSIGGTSNITPTGTSGTTGGSSLGGASGSGGGSFGSSPGASGGGFSLGGGAGSATGSGTSGGSNSGSSNGSVGSQSATEFKGGGAPIVGVGSAATGKSILEPNEQGTYETWEFLYDPRIEQMKARASLFGGASTSTSATTFGSGGGTSSPGGTTPGGTTPGSTPFGTSPSSPTPSTTPGTTP